MKEKNCTASTWRSFYKKILSNKEIGTAEWFQYFANTNDCKIFAHGMNREQRLLICCKLLPVFPEISKVYRAKGYFAIIDAALEDLLAQCLQLINYLNFRNIELEEMLEKCVKETEAQKQLKATEEKMEAEKDADPKEEEDDSTKNDALLDMYEKEVILSALNLNGGVKRLAAKDLNITTRSLTKKMEKYGIEAKK